ncbi:hypothetical protein CRP01_17390 [Flavilitoribacter nigricans DSM 23189 = NBRC 102662]|uniref:Uncharacterized protein n=1 Tax=Flavilitoribacter nigricans (strain ATCC 23147 / DSM 23189 / NBRC 102662 / NCIMB 1420 / SS-2) TaxID=1122177 RepID=A0A2D0NA98_FLAN2|nr:hypothetical protein CRP01_17390 [Flavilitoribacter nigricans DSM 23189 = NBRC 102662]
MDHKGIQFIGLPFSISPDGGKIEEAEHVEHVLASGASGTVDVGVLDEEFIQVALYFLQQVGGAELGQESVGPTRCLWRLFFHLRCLTLK